MVSSIFPKYKNKKIHADDLTFDSKLEYNIYLKLKEFQKDNNFEIVLHPRYELQQSFYFENKKIKPIHYIADFNIIFADGTNLILDAKGLETTVFKLKKKMFQFKYSKDIVCIKSVKQFKTFFENYLSEISQI